MTTEPSIYDFGFDQSLNKVSNDTGQNPMVFNSPEVGTTAQVLTGGLLTSKSTGSTNSPGIQIGLVQSANGSNLAPFDVANDGTGDIRRVGAIKLASASDLGISTLTPAPTSNKVIYASGNDLHINVPTTSAKVYVDINGVTWLATGMDTMTYANPLSIDVTKSSLHYVLTTAAVGNSTFNLSGVGIPGQEITILILNDSGANRTITWGTNFRTVSPNTVGLVNTFTVFKFVSDGVTGFIETSELSGF